MPLQHTTTMDYDRIIFTIAAAQHGVVSRAQLLCAGVPAHAIDDRVRKGRLQALHHTVYRLGPVRSPHEYVMAAVLACGTGALASHHSAATLHELAPPRTTLVHVTVQHGTGSRPRGVCVHRVHVIRAEDVAQVDGVPCTSAARTLFDMAGCTEERELERMIATAERLRVVNTDALHHVIALNADRRGVGRLRALLGRAERSALTRSEAEARFLALIRRAQLPAPAVNVKVRGYEVDFLWRAERLVVEIDGFAYHSSKEAFERDRQRDAVLLAAGFRVLRVTWRQIAEQPEALLIRVAQALVHSHALVQ